MVLQMHVVKNLLGALDFVVFSPFEVHKGLAKNGIKRI
jgi:hypothetical protein